MQTLSSGDGSDDIATLRQSLLDYLKSAGSIHTRTSSIRNLIANYAPSELPKADPFFRDFHRDWNIERLEKTPHHQATIQVGGINVEVRFTSWDEPQGVNLARLTIENHSLQVASLNTSWGEL